MRALFLLTKYNAAIPGLAGRPGLDESWLRHRLDLFRDWPLAAVRAQSRRPDRWMIFVDAETPSSHRDALERTVEGQGELVPVSGPLDDNRVRDLVGARLGSAVGSLLSVRLDSDDAIATSYLDRVSAAAQDWRGFVNAPLGYRLSEGRVLRCRDRTGPFLSFVEDLDGKLPQTVFQAPHHEAARHGPLRQLAGPAAWLQVVHGGNLANRFCGWPADARRLRADLGIEGPHPWAAADPLGVRELASAVFGQVRHELGWWMRQAPRLPGRLR